jgi:hypothetical protein
MNLRGLLVLAPTLAHAQVAAEREAHYTEPIHVGFGGQLAYGMAYADGIPDAWALRFEEGMYPVIATPREIGPILELTLGTDYWRAGHGTWGLALPVEVRIGVRAEVARAAIGFGADAMLIDQVHGDTGFGMFAPLVSATAGLDIAHVTLLADARVVRRWQFGADDYTQWMFTLGIGYTFETREALQALR